MGRARQLVQLVREGGRFPAPSYDRALAAAAVATTAFAIWRLAGALDYSAQTTPAAPAHVAVTAFAAARPPLVRTEPVRAPAAAAGSRRPEPRTSPAPAGELHGAINLLARGRRRDEFQAGLTRMSTYAPFIRAVMRDRGVPPDLLYLAMIESSFLPNAVSKAGATGMWQFMPATGAMYGLEVSRYVDERRDPVKSTLAAVRHLDDLHREFRSWHLALAAYNAGSPRIRRVLRRHAGGRVGSEVLYWQIRPHLPAETRAYVPLFLAAAEIARRPSAYGFSSASAAPLTFREAWYPGGTRLEDVARSRGLPPDQVASLNPHLIRGMTPPGRAWRVRLPHQPNLERSRSK
jgi:soluble lytic murein transglycosylase-like protein